MGTYFAGKEIAGIFSPPYYCFALKPPKHMTLLSKSYEIIAYNGDQLSHVFSLDS